MTLIGGNSTITSTPGTGQNAVLTLVSLSRSTGGTINFTGAGLGGSSNKIALTTAPTLVNGILPYATVNGTDFATHGGNGTSVVAFSGYTTSLPSGGGTGTENVRLTANATVSQNTAINSLVLAGNVTLTINAGVTLTIGSGGLLATGGNAIISSGILAVGSAEALLLTDTRSSHFEGKTFGGSVG